MPCYCNEIGRGTRDVQRLETALSKLHTMQDSFESHIPSSVGRLNAMLENAVSPDNIGKLTKEIRDLGKPQKTAVNVSVFTCKRVLDQLYSTLEFWRAADSRYHSELAAAAEAAAAVATKGGRR